MESKEPMEKAGSPVMNPTSRSYMDLLTSPVSMSDILMDSGSHTGQHLWLFTQSWIILNLLTQNFSVCLTASNRDSEKKWSLPWVISFPYHDF